jgi:Putative neutral zinc metallopeptidase
MLEDPIFWVFVLPGLLLGAYAQSRIKINIAKYSQVRTQDGITGAEVARRLLDSQGLQTVEIESTPGTPRRPAGACASRHRHGPARRSQARESAGAAGGASLWSERGPGSRAMCCRRGRDCARVPRPRLVHEGARRGIGNSRSTWRPDERRPCSGKSGRLG